MARFCGGRYVGGRSKRRPYECEENATANAKRSESERKEKAKARTKSKTPAGSPSGLRINRRYGCEIYDSPDYKTFVRLARAGNLVPVYDCFTADLLTPVGAYLRMARRAKYSFLLESVEGGENIARYTFVGADPAEVFRSRERRCVVESASGCEKFDENPIEVLRRLMARYKPVRVAGLPPLIGGAIGYFAYDMVRLIERIPSTGSDELKLDDAVLMFYRGLVAFDHVRHRVWIVQNVFTEGAGSFAREV